MKRREGSMIKQKNVHKRQGILGFARSLSLLLALAMLITLFPQQARAELPEPAEPVEVELNVYSTACDSGVMDGVYFDNVFYVNTETLEKFTGICRTYLGGDGELELAAFHSQRHLVIMPEGAGTEVIGSQTVHFDCPYLVFEEQPYVSLLHLLRYLDVPVTFAGNETEPVHLYITAPYTIYDAVAEYGSGMDSEFSWYEASTDQESVDKYLTRTGASILLLYYKISFRQAWFHEEEVEQNVLQDAITRVIKEEGEDYADRLDDKLDAFNRASAALDAEVDWLGYYTDVMKDLIEGGQKLGSTKAMDFLGNSATIAGGAGKGISGLMDAITSISTYSEMTQLQKELLEKTILSGQGAYVEKDYPNFYQACKNVMTAIAESNDGSAKTETMDAIIKVLQGAASDMLIEGFTGGGPVLLAMKAVPTSATLLGDVEKDAFLMIALEAMAMQEYAIPIYAEKLNSIRKTDWYVGRGWKEQLRALQYDMILALKSSGAARHYAIRSGQFPLDESAMTAKNEKAAILLRKVEQAVILEPGKTNVYTGEDLHWIKELQLPKYGNSCNNINLGGIAAYSRAYKAYAFRGNDSHTHHNGGTTFYTYDLCLEDEKGNVKVLSETANQNPCIGIVRDWVYYLSSSETSYSGTIRRVKMDGTGDEAVLNKAVTVFYVAFGRLYYVAWNQGDAGAKLYRCKMDGTESIALAELASDDHLEGVWIYSRDLLYYTKTSMAGGAVGFEGGPTGLFLVEIIKGEEETIAAESQLYEGDHRLATQAGEDLVFGDPYTNKLMVYHTKTEVFGELGTAEYYMQNGDLEGILVMCEDFDIKKALLDPEKEQYTPGTETLAKGTNMNIAGDRVYYVRQGSADVTFFQ